MKCKSRWTCAVAVCAEAVSEQPWWRRRAKLQPQVEEGGELEKIGLLRDGLGSRVFGGRPEEGQETLSSAGSLVPVNTPFVRGRGAR